jgi:hypothetical protein
MHGQGFGTDDNLHHIQDVDITGENGEALSLGRISIPGQDRCMGKRRQCNKIKADE